MLKRILDFAKSELTDPAVQRGLVVALSMVALRIGLQYGMDQAHADELAAGIWSFFTVAVSRAQGKP